jgi:hypothetical protein
VEECRVVTRRGKVVWYMGKEGASMVLPTPKNEGFSLVP